MTKANLLNAVAAGILAPAPGTFESAVPAFSGKLAVVLNIGLVGNPYSGLVQRLRAREYADDIAKGFRAVSGGGEPVEDHVLLLQTYYPAGGADYPGDVVMWSEHVTEVTDVVSFDVAVNSRRSPAAALQPLAYWLAQHWGQDAIAVTWADHWAQDALTMAKGGALWGPNERAWGLFDASKWQPFNGGADNVPARFPKA